MSEAGFRLTDAFAHSEYEFCVMSEMNIEARSQSMTTSTGCGFGHSFKRRRSRRAGPTPNNRSLALMRQPQGPQAHMLMQAAFVFWA